MDNILIRKASEVEMLALWGYKDLKTASPTAKLFYDNIAAGNAVFWTLDREGELIGELYMFLNLDDHDLADGKSIAYLCAFRVKKEYRGQGLGTWMMQTALADLKEKGFQHATIGVSPDEPKNVELYHRLGFVMKVKTCYYDPCGLDEHRQPEYDEKGWWLLSKEL